MKNPFEIMGEKLAQVLKQDELDKLQSTTNEIMEMLVSNEFIHDAFLDVKELQQFIGSKINQILINNLIK
jgi:hypothetical protein